ATPAARRTGNIRNMGPSLAVEIFRKSRAGRSASKGASTAARVRAVCPAPGFARAARRAYRSTTDKLRRAPMPTIDRRNFLRASAAVSLLPSLPADLMAQATVAAPASRWDAGSVRHLLPAVSDSRMLIKASFDAPLSEAPTLRVGGTSVRGRMGDTHGEHWHFYATDLQPGRPHSLSLAGARGAALCEPWELATFPAPDAPPEKFRLLIFTCPGGHKVPNIMPTAGRSRRLRRALSFAPDAVVANGDQVYWDLLAPVGARLLGMSPEAVKLAGTFDRSAVVLGGDNEAVLKRAAGPQIMPVYGT